MIYLHDLFSLDGLEAAIDNGYVRRQFHQSEPLAILNYSELAQFERFWDEITLTCRGLVYNTQTLQVTARPFRKFFNHDEPNAPVIELNESVHVTDKMDGSMGALFQKPSGGWAIATRGSFHSEQAAHATELFNSKYVSWQPADHLTYIFEIIFPENRIVCDYGNMDDLVLLGAVGIDSGRVYGPNEIPAGELWPGPRTEVFECSSYGEALSMPPREGKEGVVIRTSDGRTVKWKQEDYIYLHRIVTGLNARAVWQLMIDGKSLEECVDGVPDEFHGFIKDVYSFISNHVDYALEVCQSEFEEIKQKAEEDAEVFGNPRKAFAMLAKTSLNRGYLFMLYDGRDIKGEILKNARPDAGWTLVRDQELVG